MSNVAESSAAEGLTVEQAIANLQQEEDLGLRYYAAWWLGKFQVEEPAAIDALLMALQDEADRSPDGGYPLRRNAARALGKVGKNDDRVIPALIDCLNCPDFYVRQGSAQSLEMLGDSTAVAALLNLLEGGVEAAIQVPGKPHLTQPYEAILEALGSLQATEAIPAIEPFLDHPVVKVQFAAARAMYQLTEDPVYGERLVEGLQVKQLPLRRSALLDLGAIGYFPAANAIAKTYAENSIKLVALKGLVEHLLKKNPSSDGALTEEITQVMTLMDSLL